MFALAALGNNINPQAGKSLNFLFHADKIKQILARYQINKQVKVTGGRRCHFGHGTEQANIQRPIFLVISCSCREIVSIVFIFSFEKEFYRTSWRYI